MTVMTRTIRSTRAQSQRVLGVDASLRSTGLALVQARGSLMEALEYDVVKNPADRPFSACLKNLTEATSRISADGHPQAVAVEGIFYCKNVKTAVILGAARGAIISACAMAELPIYEYAPRVIKQSVAGYGNADKEQVRKMIMAIFKLNDEPREDAADALAIAMCHLQHASHNALLRPKTI